MAFVRKRRRFLAAMVVAAAVCGVAAGLVFAGGASGNALARGKPAVLASGSFRSITWGTTGTASIVREPHGRLVVRLSKNFLTHRAPELYVYLVKLRGQQRVEWKQVGTLKQFWGGQDYAIPKLTASDLNAQVAIYCAKCNKFNGLAQLAPTS
jgi:hypothetical protein